MLSKLSTMYLLGRYSRLLLMALLAVTSVQTLTLTRVSVPEYIKLTEPVTLTCLFDLEGEELYSLKWYKDDSEFYRYEPGADQPKKFFHDAGVHVNLSASNMTHVRLRGATVRYTGSYICEVSTEAPSFITRQNQSLLHVVAPPMKALEIVGVRPTYRVDSEVHINCTCHRSLPAALMRWYINGAEASAGQVMIFSPEIHTDGFTSTTAGLRFSAYQRLFSDADLIDVKCMALLPSSQTPLYMLSQHSSLRLDTDPTTSHVIDGATAGSSASSCVVCQHLSHWIIVAVGMYLSL